MKSAIRHALFATYSFTALAAFAGVALAHVPDTGLSASRLSPKVTIAGTLICEANASTQGDTCDLEIQDDSTGKIYQIQEGSKAQAMQFYQNGQTSVAVQGRLIDDDTVEVRSTQKI
jgi:hypothetical protein